MLRRGDAGGKERLVDVATIDQEYAQLQQESAEVTQAIQGFAQKLQTAGDAGDAQAKEWILDLKSLALSIQQEQLQTQALLQALHDFSVNTLQQQAQPAPLPQAQAPQAAAEPASGGGMLSRFRGGGFGQAITQGEASASGSVSRIR
jgi:hypothetical protein